MKRREFRFGPGAASVLTAIVVFAMSILGFMSLKEAQNENKLSDRALRFAVEELRAQALAEERLCELDGIISEARAYKKADALPAEEVQRRLPEDMSVSPAGEISFVQKSDGVRSLYIKVRLLPDDAPLRYEITQYAFLADHQ